jgi:hypothetical protein
MIIAAYYIDRSYRFSPCWTVANSLREAIHKARNWAIESNCYVSIESGGKQVKLFDENGKEVNIKRRYNRQ